MKDLETKGGKSESKCTGVVVAPGSIDWIKWTLAVLKGEGEGVGGCKE